MTLTPSFPLEIFSCIIEEVSDPDKRTTLYALSLVSQYFRVEAQRALFSDPGPLCIGHRSHRHNVFIESIIASPDRLALLVRRYKQHTSWDASNPDSNAWSSTHSETTSPQQRLVTIGRIAEALRSMDNLKHLSFADSHTYYHSQPDSGAKMLLQECNFQLQSLEWRRRDDLSFLITSFLPTQNALRTFHLTDAYGNLSNVPQALRDASTHACSKLQSLSGPRLLSEIILPGKRVQYLRWTRLTMELGSSIGDIRCVARELEYVKLLDFDHTYAPPLSSFVGHLISVEVLVMSLPRAEQELRTCLGQLQHIGNLRALVLRCEPDISYVILKSHILPVFANCKNLTFVDVMYNGGQKMVHITTSIAGDLKVFASSPSGKYCWERRVDFLRLSGS